MFVHHPDRGGDPVKAAEINAIYERMLKWLGGDGSKAPEAKPMIENDIAISPPSARTAKLGAFALAAVAAYAAFRRGGKRP